MHKNKNENNSTCIGFTRLYLDPPTNLSYSWNTHFTDHRGSIKGPLKGPGRCLKHPIILYNHSKELPKRVLVLIKAPNIAPLL